MESGILRLIFRAGVNSTQENVKNLDASVQKLTQAVMAANNTKSRAGPPLQLAMSDTNRSSFGVCWTSVHGFDHSIHQLSMRMPKSLKPRK